MTYGRIKAGQAGIDRRGFWVNDRKAGVRLRIGDVSANLVGEFARQGDMRTVRELVKRPHVGVWFSREF